MIKKYINKLRHISVRYISNYKILDKLYVALDRKHIRRTKNIRLIPSENNRRGGKHSYAEWAHVIGIFQTLMYIHLDKKSDNLILDVGCGTGLLGISSEPFLGKKGRYVGIDVMENDIKFCRNHYPPSSFEFIHFDVNNPAYTPFQKRKRLKWNLENERFDLVTALSVWTHLNEEDAFFYIKEVNRILKVGGKAIITFFLLDDLYERSLKKRSNEKGKYHFTPQDKWIFDKPVSDSGAWFCPKWVKVPEGAIGVTNAGFERLITGAELELIKYYPGNWKEIPGVFFQDILVFRKA